MRRALLVSTLLVAALLLVHPATGLGGDKREKSKEARLPIPPPPVAQELTVKRGEPLEVRLRIYGRNNQNLKYLIRSQPVFGKLREPKVASQEVSTVTYQPPASIEQKRDKFTYAVQNSEGVSAPVEVSITITDEAAQLIVPNTLEFAPILSGAASMKEFEISNSGGSISSGKVEVNEPWRIEGPTAYRLGAGEKQKFLLFFEPKAGGPFRTEIRYTSQIDRVTSLRGVAEAALSAEPAELLLPTISGSAVRAGEFELTNHTAAEQAILIKGPARLQFPETLTLAAGSRATVAVSAKAGNLEKIDEALVISGAGIDLRVPVRAAAVGALLKADPATVRFPNSFRSKAGTAWVWVENAGTAEGFWKAEVAAPFSVLPESVRLQPRERKQIRLTVTSDESGSFRGTLRWVGEAQTREVQLEAEVIAGMSPATTANPPRPPARARPAESSAEEQATTESGHATDERVAALLYLRNTVKVINITPHSATVEWPAALSSAHSYRLEVRKIGLNPQGEMQTDWVEQTTAKVVPRGDQFAADMYKLHPDSVHTVRIRPIDDQGAVGEPIFITQFQTIPAKKASVQVSSFGLSVFALVALALGAFVWQRVREARASAALDRAARDR